MTNHRDISIDLLKGVGIVSVIIGHLYAPLRTNLIESFHMPLFFFIAGYFYHQEDYWSMFKKKARRLLFPYVLTYFFIIIGYIATEKICTIPFILTGVLSGFFCFVAPSTFLGITLWPVLALWFLVALFLSLNIYNILYRIIPNRQLLGLLCFALAGVGWMLYHNCSPVPFCVCQAFVAMPYLYIGNMFKENESRYVSIQNMRNIIPLLLIWVIAIIWSHERISDCEYTYYPLDFAASMAATYLMYALCHKICTKNNLMIRYVVWLGKNSLAILCIHDLEWQMHIFSRISSNKLLHVLFVILLSSILIYMYDTLRQHIKTHCISL